MPSRVAAGSSGMIALIGGYAAVLAATLFGLVTMVASLVSMPILMVRGKIWPAGLRVDPYIILLCINVLLWLGIAALWGIVLGGPMPMLLFAAVFAVYGLTAKDERLTPEGFKLAGAEQWSVVVAAISHALLDGFRWY